MTDLTALIQTGWLVWSNEHRAWWRPNSCGYVTVVAGAGRFSFDKAAEICRDANYRSNSEIEREGIPPEIMVPSPELIASLLARQQQQQGER